MTRSIPDLQAVAAVAGLERRGAVAGQVVRRAEPPHGDVLIDRLLLGTLRAGRTVPPGADCSGSDADVLVPAHADVQRQRG